MNGKKDSQLVDTNYIKDGTESDTLDDPRLEKLWSKVSKVSRNWSVGNQYFFIELLAVSSESNQTWKLINALLLSTDHTAMLCSSHLCALRVLHLHPDHPDVAGCLCQIKHPHQSEGWSLGPLRSNGVFHHISLKSWLPLV